MCLTLPASSSSFFFFYCCCCCWEKQFKWKKIGLVGKPKTSLIFISALLKLPNCLYMSSRHMWKQWWLQSMTSLMKTMTSIKNITSLVETMTTAKDDTENPGRITNCRARLSESSGANCATHPLTEPAEQWPDSSGQRRETAWMWHCPASLSPFYSLDQSNGPGPPGAHANTVTIFFTLFQMER